MTLPDVIPPDQLDRAIPALLKLALQSGDRAYTDPIDRFDPAPTSDNNWLMQDDGSFAGVFVDDQPDGTDKRVRFTCVKTADGWQTETELDGSNEFAEFDLDVLDFATGQPKKKPNCKTGFSCGYSCQRQGNKCRNPLERQYNTYAEWSANQVKAKSIGISGLPHDNPQTYQEFIENGRAIAGKEFFKQAKQSYKVLERLEKQDDRAREDARYDEAFRAFARVKDSEYATVRAEYDQLIGKVSSLSDPRIIALHEQLRAVEAPLLGEYVAATTEGKKRQAAYDKALAPARSLKERLLRTSSLSEARANEIKDNMSAYYAGKDIPAHIEAGVSEFYRLTNGQGSNSLEHIDITDAKRAFADRSNKKIEINASNGKEVLFHEMGHHVEYESPTLSTASRVFVRSKAEASQGTTNIYAEKLNRLVPFSNYDEHELALRDSFVDPYVGKVYQNDSFATEVVSMGIERFATPGRMTKLAAVDPDHFALVLGMMRNPSRSKR